MRDFIVPMSLLSSAKRHLFGEYLAHFEQSLLQTPTYHVKMHVNKWA